MLAGTYATRRRYSRLLKEYCESRPKADKNPQGISFKGFPKPQCWPSNLAWGGSFVDAMSVETLNRVTEMLLDKQLAALISKIKKTHRSSAALPRRAHIGSRLVSGRAIAADEDDPQLDVERPRRRRRLTRLQKIATSWPDDAEQPAQATPAQLQLGQMLFLFYGSFLSPPRPWTLKMPICHCSVPATSPKYGQCKTLSFLVLCICCSSGRPAFSEISSNAAA